MGLNEGLNNEGRPYIHLWSNIWSKFNSNIIKTLRTNIKIKEVINYEYFDNTKIRHN